MYANANSDCALRAEEGLGLRLGRESGHFGSTEQPWSAQWVLKRNCSLLPSQVAGAFGLLCALSLGIALFFWTKGVTMVAPFAVLELLALGLAFLVYARRAGDAECITISRGKVTVERNVAGRLGREELPSVWARVDCVPDGRSPVTLAVQGRRVTLGCLARPELRAELARELRLALRRSGEAASSPSEEITSKQN
jgi:uncharacterized membrane protein